MKVKSPESIIMQDKRLFAMMTNFDNRFGFYTREEWRTIISMIPYTMMATELKQMSENVIVKPIYGREGSDITIIDGFDIAKIDNSHEQLKAIN